MSMYRIETAIKEYLDSQNWRYKHEEDKHRFIFGMKLDCDNVDGCMLAVTARDEEDMSCKAIYEFNVPEEARTKIVEYTTRANYGLLDGNFELDLNDGEIRYKAYVPCAGLNMLPDSIIEEALAVPPLMFQKFGDGLAAVALGFSDGETAYRKTQA